MKRAASQILTVTGKDNRQYSMSVVEKQSDTGITYNKRLFVLISGVKFGYFTTYKQNDDPRLVDPSRFKAEGLIKNIQSVDQNEKMLKLKFWIKHDKTGKKEHKVWIFRFATEDLAIIWMNKINAEKAISNFRKNSHSPSKSSFSPSKSSLHPSRPDLLKNTIKQEELQYKFSKSTSQLERGNFNRKIQKPLHSHLSPHQEAIFEKSDEDPVDEKIKDKEMKIKDKEDEQRKRREIEEQVRLIERLEKQKREREREEAEILARNRQIEGWRKKDQQSLKQPILKEQPRRNDPIFIKQKAEDYDKVELGKNASKLKLKGIQYYDIVNKIIGSANELSEHESKKSLEKAHDHIFELEKMKIQKSNQDREKNRSSVKISYSEGWMYKYLIKLSEGQQYEVIQQFKQFCQMMLKQIVQELYIPERKRRIVPKYKGKDFHHYEIDDLEIKIAMFDIKQVFSQEEPGNKDRICDVSNAKKLSNQFKNYKILYNAIENQGVVRIPLVCLCQYRGFISLFKATSQFDRQGIQSNQYDKNVQRCLENISERSKADLQILRSRQNMMILKLNAKYYHELALEVGKGHLNFEYYIIQEIKYLMPPDFLFHKKHNPHFIPEKHQYQTYLRQQLLQNYLDKKQTIQSIIFLGLKKQRTSKIPTLKNDKQSEAKLEQLSQNIVAAITSTIQQLEDLSFYFMHPKQISQFLHKKGINMRYLGFIYEHISIPFAKSCIISEIAARSCKMLFRKTIHQIHFLDQNIDNQAKFNKNILDKVMDFLNCVVGNTIQTVAIWKVLSNHSSEYFKTTLHYEQIQKGYFIISLIYHCGIEVDWSKIKISQVFETQAFFTPENTNGISFKTKSLPPLFNSNQKNLMIRVQKQNQEAFSEFFKQFLFDKDELPSSIVNSKYYSHILKYLVNFIPPSNLMDTNENSLSQFNLYKYLGCPTRQQIDLQLSQLKWYLRKGKKDKYVKTFSGLLSKITKFFGDFHPLLSQIYETMSTYHKNNNQYEDSITFAKSSLVNMLKICGVNHLKVGQCYFQLAACCIKSGKKEQAMLNLKKAKKIFQNNQKTDSVAYAFVTLKLGLLFLSENRVKQCENIVLYSVQILEKKAIYEGEFEDEIIEGYQLLARCYEVMQQKKEQKQLGKLASQKLLTVQQSGNLEKLLKITLYPILNSLPSEKSSTFLDLISQIPINIGADTYIRSYTFLQNRMKEKSFLDNLYSYIDNLEHIENYILENDTLKTWVTLKQIYERETVNDFISMIEELAYFIGDGFLVGALRESL